MNTGGKDGLGYLLFSSVWRRKWRLILCALIAAAVASLSSVSGQLSRATSYIKLNFESAHDGLTPAGARFNIYDIQKEALMTRALNMTGLSGALTWRELADQLTVSPSRTQSVSKRYIATEYTATLTYNEAFGNIDARSMLDVILRLYYEDFLSQSGMNHSLLDVDWSALDGMEYIEAGEYAQSRADILRQFLLSRIAGSGGYVSEDPSLSFRALLTTVETFESVYIGKYMALVEQGHLFKDVNAYSQKLTYQRMLVDQSYQLSRAQLAIREKALADYEESLVAIVMVPTYYEGNGLYMSRTQTGIDTLTKAAENYSTISQRQALKLALIDGEIASLAQASSAAVERAAALLDEVALRYDELLARVKRADEAYMAFTARDYVSFSPRVIGLIDAYGVKDALLYGAITAFIIALWFIMYDTRKRARRKPKAKGAGDA